jgi:hypothetical protein
VANVLSVSAKKRMWGRIKRSVPVCVGGIVHSRINLADNPEEQSMAKKTKATLKD